MGFLEQPWGYFFGGAIVVGGLVWLVLWLRSRNISVTWYEWLIGAIGLLLLIFSIQNIFAAYAEFETTAPSRFLLLFGLPGLIIMAIAGQLVWRRNRSAAK